MFKWNQMKKYFFISKNEYIIMSHAIRGAVEHVILNFEITRWFFRYYSFMCLTSWLVLFIDDMNLYLVDLWRIRLGHIFWIFLMVILAHG